MGISGENLFKISCRAITIIQKGAPINLQLILTYSKFAIYIREGVKKNCEKAVRLTALGGGGGGVTPLQPDQNYLWQF